MSLDLSIGGCPNCGENGEDFNYTYNVSKMWHYIYPDDDYMLHIEGLKGKETIKLLQDSYRKLKNNEHELVKMNPKNGWGSYEGFLEFISKLIQASIKYPDDVWSASR
jgi:hypothetical protein